MIMKYLPLILVFLAATILGSAQWKRHGELKTALAGIRSETAAPDKLGVSSESLAGPENESQGSDAGTQAAIRILEDAKAMVRPGYLTSHQWQELESAVFFVPTADLPRVLDELLGDGTKNLNSSVVSAIFERWAAADREAALERANSLPGSLRHSALKGIVTSWAEEDGDAAFAFAVETNSNESYEGLLARSVIEAVAASDFEKALVLAGDDRSSVALAVRVWGMRDSRGALEWLIEQKESSYHGLIGELIEGIAARDQNEAIEFADSLDEGTEKSTALGAVYGHWATEDFAAASSALLGELDSTSDRIRILDEFADFLDGVDPHELLRLAEQLPADVARDQFLRKVVWKLSDQKIAAALASMIHHDGTFGDALSGVLQEWVVADPAAASEFLGELEASPAKDAAIKSFTTGLLREDAEAAILWAESMDNAEGRDQQMIYLLEHWHVYDKEAASAWVKANRSRVPGQ